MKKKIKGQRTAPRSWRCPPTFRSSGIITTQSAKTETSRRRSGRHAADVGNQITAALMLKDPK